MIEFDYKPKNNDDSRNKPKIYFSCHPKDHDQWFEDITEDILKVLDCIIYYLPPSEEPIEDVQEYTASISEMQMVLIPVTSNFLNDKNRALDFDFKFALGEKIPILPIAVEPQLEPKFNLRCENIQLLDKTNTDRTAISYEGKLKKFLNSVFVAENFVEKIKEAFDAYVFLSYRKKDRKYAQELMELIHRNEFCRDIAIWYDEFLTPGENFNTAIQKALEKSHLFALTVTPNILEDDNYVMKQEYPFAQSLNMRIIPIEMQNTDRQELKKKYINIPVCANAYNEIELKKVFSNSLKGIALRKNDSPEHNFFIGLAYLSGIDVEMNFERAHELIKDSANKGLPEAIHQMAKLYYGRKLDKDETIKWLQKSIELKRGQYKLIPSNVALLENIFIDYSELFEIYAHHNVLKSKESFIEAVRFTESVGEKELFHVSKKIMIAFRGSCANLLRHRNRLTAYYSEESRFIDHEEWIEYYERFSKIYRADFNNEQLISTYHLISECRTKKNENQLAMQYAEKALALSKIEAKKCYDKMDISLLKTNYSKCIFFDLPADIQDYTFALTNVYLSFFCLAKASEAFCEYSITLSYIKSCLICAEYLRKQYNFICGELAETYDILSSIFAKQEKEFLSKKMKETSNQINRCMMKKQRLIPVLDDILCQELEIDKNQFFLN